MIQGGEVQADGGWGNDTAPTAQPIAGGTTWAEPVAASVTQWVCD